MDKYPEYDFYNSREECDGKEGRGEEQEEEMEGKDEGKDKTGGIPHRISRERRAIHIKTGGEKRRKTG